MNKVIVSGHLGRDAETAFTDSGRARTKFSVASTVWWFDKITRERRETTTWVNCVGWGERYEKLAEYLTKGKKVIVEGKLSVRKYTGRDGTEKTATEVNLTDVELLGGGKREERRDEPPSEPEPGDFSENDIPF